MESGIGNREIGNSIRRKHMRSVIAAVLLVVPLLISPMSASANHAAAECTKAAAQIAGELLGVTGIEAGIAALIGLFKTKAAATEVPAQSTADVTHQTTQTGKSSIFSEAGYLNQVFERTNKTCFKATAVDLARAAVKAARDSIIKWVNTGNMDVTPTFVTNFEFDAQKTAENAARLFASQLTNIDFCNYFPVTPTVNLDFQLNARIGLECNFQKSSREYREALKDPSLFSTEEKIAMFLDDATDPLLVELNAKSQLATVISQKKEARRTQVTSGKGFTGVEKCVKWQTSTGLSCTSGDDEDCFCAEKKTLTPGAYVADLATEPLKSEFRESELIKDIEEAIGAVLNAALGKVINDGLNAAFNP